MTMILTELIYNNDFDRSGTVLSSHYALFHTLGLIADLIRFINLHCWNCGTSWGLINIFYSENEKKKTVMTLKCPSEICQL